MRRYAAEATTSEPEPPKGTRTQPPASECTLTILSQIWSGFIDGWAPYRLSLEREFSRGMSHQFLGGRPRASDSGVTRPTCSQQ